MWEENPINICTTILLSSFGFLRKLFFPVKLTKKCIGVRLLVHQGNCLSSWAILTHSFLVHPQDPVCTYMLCFKVKLYTLYFLEHLFILYRVLYQNWLMIKYTDLDTYTHAHVSSEGPITAMDTYENLRTEVWDTVICIWKYSKVFLPKRGIHKIFLLHSLFLPSLLSFLFSLFFFSFPIKISEGFLIHPLWLWKSLVQHSVLFNFPCFLGKSLSWWLPANLNIRVQLPLLPVKAS